MTYICVSKQIIGSDNGLSAPSHYLNQCWNIVDSSIRNKLQWNLKQNSYIFIEENVIWEMAAILSRPQCVKHIDVETKLPNENVWISLTVSMKFVPEVRINNIPALVQIMAWRWPGDKPLSEPMMVSLLTHICVTRPQWASQCFITILCCKVWFTPIYKPLQLMS